MRKLRKYDLKLKYVYILPFSVLIFCKFLNFKWEYGRLAML